MEGIISTEQTFSKEENDVLKLRGLAKQLSERVNLKEGILNLLTSDCRINPEAYVGAFGFTEEILELDEETVADLRNKWNKKEKYLSTGEKFELLITIILSKFLGADYIVARASEFDDYSGGIDHIILNKKTGNLVCGFDEVADDSNKFYAEKKEKVLKKNVRSGGGYLQYGLKAEEVDGERKVKLCESRATPVFFLALSRNKINDLIEKIPENLDEVSKLENEEFANIIISLKEQCDEILGQRNLELSFRKSVEDFKGLLGDFIL